MNACFIAVAVLKFVLYIPVIRQEQVVLVTWTFRISALCIVISHVRGNCRAPNTEKK